MIALIIFGAVICLLLILCFLPLSIDLAYEHKFMFKIKYAGITLLNSTKDSISKTDGNKKQKNTPSKPKENFIKKTYKQKGLLGTVQYFSNILKIVLKKFGWLAKRFKFRKFKFDLTVATDDAAKTAIQYGEVCAALYPVFSIIQSAVDIKTKSVNVNADFDKTNWEFKTCVLVRARLLYWVIATVGVVSQYLKLQRKECEKA